MESNQQTEQVDIPKKITERIEKRVKYTEFESKSAYIAYVLDEVLYQVNKEDINTESTDVNEKQVQNRLESLGYLNE